MKYTYPALIIRALELAAQWHEGQWRKHPTEQIPYIAHPAGVGMLLERAGFGEEVVAAGILHDVIEDCDVTPEELSQAMNARIAELVLFVTEPPKVRSWRERKDAYLEQLRHAPVEALAIACADHIYNLHSLLQSAKMSENVWSLFKAAREEKIKYEEAVLATVTARLQNPLVDELRQVVEQVRALPVSTQG
jgi:(p)ppGpp synthase/HD superfamily hydrolase